MIDYKLTAALRDIWDFTMAVNCGYVTSKEHKPLTEGPLQETKVFPVIDANANYFFFYSNAKILHRYC